MQTHNYKMPPINFNIDNLLAIVKFTIVNKVSLLRVSKQMFETILSICDLVLNFKKKKVCRPGGGGMCL